jgi:CyaY protein
MNDELEFRRAAQVALSSLKKHLLEHEQTGQSHYEIQELDGALNILLDDPGARFVITIHTPLRQIWIAALSATFKLDWRSTLEAFIEPRTGETLTTLVDRLISEYHAPGAGRL